MKWWIALLLACTIGICGMPTFAQNENMVNNGSFEPNLLHWTANSSYTVQSVASGWQGVTAADGNKFAAISGPANPGLSYAQLLSQSLSAPFGTGIPTDNFPLYLYAYTYLHTTDGRNVSYDIVLQPGYGQMDATWRPSGQNQWVESQAIGYYMAHDPYNSGSTAKPIVVSLELRDPLNAGEYLLIDYVWLAYGGPGI